MISAPESNRTHLGLTSETLHEMANYQSYPQLGGINTQDYLAQSGEAMDPTVTGYTYGFPSGLPYVNGNTARESAPVLPHVNASPFQVNGSRSISPRSKVMQHDSLVSGGRPSLNARPSPSAQTLSHIHSQLQADSTLVQAISSATVNPQPLSVANNTKVSIHAIKTTDAAESDIEDGEVDDEGIDKPPNVTKEAEMGAMFSSRTPHDPTEHDNLAHARDETVVVSSASGPNPERDQGNFAQSHAKSRP